MFWIEMSDRSKIALFLPSLRGGGAERTMLRLAREFVACGQHVDLVLVELEGEYLDEVPDDVNTINIDKSRSLKSLLPFISYLQTHRPDVVLSTIPNVNLIAIWASLIVPFPVRTVIREPNPPATSSGSKGRKGRLTDFLCRRFYRFADHVVAISEDIVSELRPEYNVSSSDLTVIHNPVFTSDITEAAAEPLDDSWFGDRDVPVVLSVGRLAEQKRFTDLLSAFTEVRKVCDAQLVLLGEGPKRAELERRAAELGISESVKMPGFVDNPFHYMANADVFVSSSKYEGFGNVIVEALACGCPVVATDCPGGPSEILEGGKYGRLVPVGDTYILGQAIVETLGEEIDKDRLVDRAKDFRVRRISRAYADVLLDCSAETPTNPGGY
jgi:glycosyltransferase involved in cell wall biosynthesis